MMNGTDRADYLAHNFMFDCSTEPPTRIESVGSCEGTLDPMFPIAQRIVDGYGPTLRRLADS